MALGDETIIGPYDCTTAGVTSAGADLDTAAVNQTDRSHVIVGANGLQFWIIHIEGA